MRYRCKKVFSLTQWSGQIRAEFHVFDSTQELLRWRFIFEYGIITLYDVPFQRLLLTKRSNLGSLLADPKQPYNTSYSNA